ncbi:MAG: hypothetical protein ABIP51_21895 [Bacteroidia bacterium]
MDPGQSGLDPESNWFVKVSDSSVEMIDPGKVTQSILISEIENVSVATNDRGPFEIDIWWILSGNGKAVLVPGGATGEKEMLNRLQELPGFNNGEVIKAMGCSDNAEFLLWKKA